MHCSQNFSPSYGPRPGPHGPIWAHMGPYGPMGPMGPRAHTHTHDHHKNDTNHYMHCNYHTHDQTCNTCNECYHYKHYLYLQHHNYDQLHDIMQGMSEKKRGEEIHISRLGSPHLVEEMGDEGKNRGARKKITHLTLRSSPPGGRDGR